MRITGVVNQKGGVGKTNVTAGTAGALADRGHRVLAVDLDPQGHLTVSALQLDRIPAEEASLAAALAGDYTDDAGALVAEHSHTQAGGRLDVLPNSLRMWTAARDLDKRPDRERQLARLLASLADDYDHALIDCPPALDILTDNALAALHGMLCPVQPEDTSIEALRILFAQVHALERALHRPPIQRHGLVVSNYRRPLSRVANSVLTRLSELEDLPVLAHLPLAVAVQEAWRHGDPVSTYAPEHDITHGLGALADALDHAAKETHA